MDRIYAAMAFDPPSAHYVGATMLSVPFQLYDEEGEIINGPEGMSTSDLADRQARTSFQH
jgi:cleavage and polyadenylation specificity factor subunit 1